MVLRPKYLPIWSPWAPPWSQYPVSMQGGATMGSGVMEKAQGLLCASCSHRAVQRAATHPGCWRAGATWVGAWGWVPLWWRAQHSVRFSGVCAHVSALFFLSICETMCQTNGFCFLLGRMFIFYGNKTSTQFLNFTPTLICSDDLQANILGPVSPTPLTGSQPSGI